MQVVLDASALLAFLRQEPGSELVDQVLGAAVLTSVNWAEVVQKSLSAGVNVDGLRQDLQAFVITPICPHTLTNRPLVDSANCVYSLTAPELPAGATLVIDGQIKRLLKPDDRIEIRKAAVNFQLARLPDHSYYGTLHRKLGWGGQPDFENHNRPQAPKVIP